VFFSLDLAALDNSIMTANVKFERPFAAFGGKAKHYTQKQISTALASDLAKWDQLLSSIRSLGSLHQNWDGYGALGIISNTVDNVVCAAEALSDFHPPIPAPEVSPTSSGTISLAWDNANLDAVIEFGLTRYSGYVQVRHQPVVFLEGDARNFGPDDCAVFAAAIKADVASRTINSIEFARFSTDT